MRHLSRTCAVVSAMAFVALVGLMQFDPDEFVRLDTLATSLVHPLQTFSWVQFFIVITTLGSTTGVIAIALLFAVFIRHERTLVARLVLGLIGSSISAQIIKSLIHRVRPDALPWIGALHSFSFPSGHSTSAMVLFGFIAVVCAKKLNTPSMRYALVLFSALLILAIGASRIVLAAHYFSDVLAGFLLGAFWLAFVFLIPVPRWLVRIG